ncbi:hypothetical protein Q0590_23090 [Rhodocytophaga aerolata]|uniref:Uncharacterized protein n=1 Tax=Rhodocytophaga aerolata TaxID=455078 RepID=A0ABT8RAQ6_9BACT|nr:hypothetical protein [Rhodocytophaga aerolata]MDO1449181.1 hypothetical protein [Rhodocytophaga aerolata]
MKKLLLIVLFSFFHQVLFSQDIRIYHGEISESVFLKQNDKLENSSRESVKITRGVNGIVTIHILNPNPFFYNYEIKTEDVDIKDDYSDQFAELVKLINALPDVSNLLANSIPVPAAVGGGPSSFDIYKTYLVLLNTDLTNAKSFIEASDRPETVEEALKRVSNNAGYGFRAAVAKIQQNLPSVKGRFNSKSLEKDLNDILEQAVSDGTFDASLTLGGDATLIALFKSAFLGLNNQLATAVKEILKVTEKDRIIRFTVPVKDNKQTNVKLIITKINAEANTVRELLNEEVAAILPLYVRKRFEIVPVVNLVFQANRQKFSIENNLVRSVSDDDAKFNIGAMALMNFASFGEFKEYGVGFGIGYSIQPNGKASSFFAIPSLSYKDIVRFGFGFGYNLSPVGLTNGAKVDAPLPPNISNIEDVIDYQRKPAVVFTIAIAGIKL